MAPRALVDEIARWPLFASVSPQLRERLAAAAHAITLAKGEVLFRRGTPATGFYGVATGMMQLSVTSAEGVSKVVELIAPGHTLGEAIMFHGGTFPVDATALVHTTVLKIPASIVDQLFDDDPTFARAMLASLSMRLHTLIRDVEMYTLHSASARVAALLLGEHDAAGEGSVTLPSSKQVCASRLGMTPETFSRAMKELTERGVISVHGRRVELRDPAALETLVS